MDLFIHRIVVYYQKMLKDSNEKKIKLLKEQIAMVSTRSIRTVAKINITGEMGIINNFR